MTVPLRKQDTVRPRLGTGAELGVVNPTRVGSTLYEDFIPQLRGRQAVRVYEEMGWNDATIGAILYAIEQLVRQVQWSVESEDETTKEFLDANIHDLDHSWNDFISQAISEIQYGWAIFETVYRFGDDGRIWWRKFGFRAQSSLYEWKLDAGGELEAFIQTVPHGNVTIPAVKLVHFRTSTGDGRPEGRSWLRRAYRSWYMKKRVEDITAIGIERDLNGVPIARVPAEVALAGPGNPEYDIVKRIVTGLKVDELQGIIWPGDVDENGHRYFDLELLSTGGRPKTDSLMFIRAMAQDIASVMLAQFIGLGRDTVGSRALAEPQQELFQVALGALLDSIEEQFHRQATMRLLDLNGLASGRITHGEIRDIDLDALSNFILRIAQAGGDFFPADGSGMDEFRQMAGLDPVDLLILEDENVEQEPDEATYTATPGAVSDE